MNRLQFEHSPYLLQHKNNPVDWYPWGEAALNKAKIEDKPILLSIGYSSCHWCHVMEHESFSDIKVAEYMNANFVCIKLDREERPDLDKIYMDAIVSITGQGGWPLNCFLTPELKPFYGGTYFPPQPMHQRPSWLQVLQFIVKMVHEKKQEIEDQADRMIKYISNASQTLRQVSRLEKIDIAKDDIVNKLYQSISSRFDRAHGGFGAAPKFPSIHSLTLLLDIYFFSGNKDALDFVFFTLRKMARAGIYDQLAGGFARYATDKEWNIPHFEKMLYDNAQLISIYSKAYKYRKDPLFKKVVMETTSWLDYSMKSNEGGYFSAIDADSEGEEGRYYVWTVEELKSTLSGAEYNILDSIFEISEEGNWRDPFHSDGRTKNILWIKPNLEEERDLYSNKFQKIKDKLLKIRSERVHPLIDTKILVSWNALLIEGWFQAYEAFSEIEYLNKADRVLDFLVAKCLAPNYYLHQLNSPIPAMLDDLAFGISACMHGYLLTEKEHYLSKAGELMNYSFQYFYDPINQSFKYSQSNDLIAQVDDLYDQTMPSASGMMALNLIRLGRLLNKFEWEEIGERILENMAGSIVKYPESLSHWASMLLCKKEGWIEVKTKEFEKMAELLTIYIPNPIFHASSDFENGYSLCHKFICEMPEESIQKFRLLLDKHYHTSV